MRTSALSQTLDERLRDFAWDEWAQMGVSAPIRRRSSWAQDPEALVIFTLEVGRDDPRLFDEVLNWLLTNEPLVSARRLKAMCMSPGDDRLLDATLAWTAQFRRRSRQEPPETPPDRRLELLFHGLSTPVRERDRAFASAGFLRGELRPTGKVWPPDLREPINLAFRLRHLLGVSARSEVVRHLLTEQGRFVVTQEIAGSAGFARRNVHEALSSLKAAGVVEVRTSAGGMHWGTDPTAWVGLLGIQSVPIRRDWPHLLAGLRTLRRWLRRQDLQGLSDYLLASEARDVLDKVRSYFEPAGISVGDSRGGESLDDLEAVVDSALAMLAE